MLVLGRMRAARLTGGARQAPVDRRPFEHTRCDLAPRSRKTGTACRLRSHAASVMWRWAAELCVTAVLKNAARPPTSGSTVAPRPEASILLLTSRGRDGMSKSGVWDEF